MDKSSIRKEAKLYFMPFILGDEKRAHNLSKKIYRKYGITCFILDSKMTLASIFDFSSRFLRLSDAQSDEIITKEIIHFAKQEPYTLPILIPCSEKYRGIVERNRTCLETTFVLSSEDTALISSPLNVIPQ